MWTPWAVEDPGGYNYTGYGNTGSILYTNRRRRVPLDRKFFIGDMVLYGPSFSDTKHVAICRKNGYKDTAIWTSHGSQAGPLPVYMYYRSDVLCVVRSLELA